MWPERLLIFAILSSVAAGQATYRIDEILPPPGLRMDGFDLNDSGLVVGQVYSNLNVVQPFVWSSGSVVVLPMPAGATSVNASRIDDAGRIFGYSETIARTRLRLPVLWQAGQPFRLPTMFQGVSQVFLPSPSSAFLLTNTKLFDDPTPGWKNQFGWTDEPDFSGTSGDLEVPAVFDLAAGSVSVAGTFASAHTVQFVDVNDRGEAVGWVESGSWNQSHAVRWDPEQGAVLLGAGGRRSSRAVAINASGTIVGRVSKTDTGDVNTDFRLRPFIWRDGVLTELPVVAGFEHSEPSDINDQGDVVGRLGVSAANPFGKDGAWIYTNGAMVDLNDLLPVGSGWSLTSAVKINNAGQILAVDATASGLGVRHALLTPQ